MENRYIPYMTNDTYMTHVPMCLACDAHEVAAPFTNDSGEGFCTAECEAEAQAEFADWKRDCERDDFLSQYDNDPSPYDGTYSEE